jgi:hypothetical protein
MTKVFCAREKPVLEGLRTGALTAELRRHAVACSVCGATLRLAPLFLASRAEAVAPPSAEETRAAWQRARAAALLEAELEGRRQAVAPLRALHVVATLAGWLLAGLSLFALANLALADAPGIADLLPGAAIASPAGVLAAFAILAVAAAAALAVLQAVDSGRARG